VALVRPVLADGQRLIALLPGLDHESVLASKQRYPDWGCERESHPSSLRGAWLAVVGQQTSGWIVTIYVQA
jgi:hypothetical protein